MTVANVSFDSDEFVISCEAFDEWRVKAAPEKRCVKMTPLVDVWFLPHSAKNAKFIFDNYNKKEIDVKAMTAILEFMHGGNRKQKLTFPLNFPFKNPPRLAKNGDPYQLDAINKAYGMEEFAFIMEMRTGKSFVDINLTCQYFLEGRINAWLIVLFPGAIKSTWKIQLAEHCPIPYDVQLMQAGNRSKLEHWIDAPSDELKILVVGIESLSNGSGPALIERFAQNNRIKFTIDESTCIKKPKAKTKNKRRTRSKLCWDVGGLSEFRTILTGTPITQGIEDLYSQYRFLNWQILGHKSYYSFQNSHCILGGFEGRKIVGYCDIDRVVEKIAPYSYQITTEEANGHIPIDEFTITVEPSKEQARLLKDLGDPYDMSTSLDGRELEVETILERMIRYQQIVGGHFPWNEEHGTSIDPLKDNPKLSALIDFVETIPLDKKIIIWARFIPEIGLISKAFPDSIVYVGGMEDQEREDAQRRFMEDDGPRFWIATQQASARGVELASASIHIFYSNSFSYDDRKQASMRTNSSHQKSSSIMYVDISMNHKTDKHMIEVLQKKQSIAQYIQKAIGEAS